MSVPLRAADQRVHRVSVRGRGTPDWGRSTGDTGLETTAPRFFALLGTPKASRDGGERSVSPKPTDSGVQLIEVPRRRNFLRGRRPQGRGPTTFPRPHRESRALSLG